jgi:outer membrane protein OmpA-like peptidoglycan-associated protein
MQNQEGTRSMSTLFKGIALVSITFAMFGCGNVSHSVAKDGRSAGEVVWPAPDAVTPMHKGGTFPNLAQLRQMHEGLNKAQVSDLIGYPHFSEGVWGVHEWNYLFNFRRPGSDEVTVCQYKVLFDDERIARSFYWKPESCASLLDEAKPQAPVHVPMTQRDPEVVTLSADALFPFDKGDVKDIMPAGRSELSALASKLRSNAGKVSTVRVVGYTDNLGSSTYNQGLSERRAQAVREILVDDGLPAAKITAEGRGEADPVKDCEAAPHAQRIACLAPNRRVEVRVESME